MEKKLCFNEGMEKLRLQKRIYDPAWELKELELQVRKRTLDNTYGIKANGLLHSFNQDFSDGFQLSLDYNDAMVKAGRGILGNKSDLSKFEGYYRSFSGHLNDLIQVANDDFKEGFLAGKNYIGNYMFELSNLLEEYYPDEEIDRIDNLEAPNPRVTEIFCDVWNVGLKENADRAQLSDDQNSSQDGELS
jgi:hypothetical protein